MGFASTCQMAIWLVACVLKLIGRGQRSFLFHLLIYTYDGQYLCVARTACAASWCNCQPASDLRANGQWEWLQHQAARAAKWPFSWPWLFAGGTPAATGQLSANDYADTRSILDRQAQLPMCKCVQLTSKPKLRRLAVGHMLRRNWWRTSSGGHRHLLCINCA